MWGNIAIAFLLSFIISFMATPYTIKFARKKGIVSGEKEERSRGTNCGIGSR